MRARNVRLAALVGSASLVVAIGSAIAAEGDGAEDAVAVAAGDDALVDQLLELEPQLPAPLPSAAELTADGIDAVLSGSFASARSQLDQVEDQLRSLFIAADDASTAVGDAVADVTRGLLVERQALLVLEETDDASARPLDTSDARDDDGLAIDADGLLGRTFTGLDVLLSGRDMQRDGYAVLAALPAEQDEDDTFDARYDQLLTYRDTVEVQLEAIAADDTDQLLVPVVRFDAPIGVARASQVQYVCVDRETYLSMADAGEAERIAAAVAAQPDASCEEAARRAGLELADQAALESTDPLDAGDLAG